jgi:hypothetical protein
MILSTKSKRVLEVALANRAAKNELLAALGSHAVVMAKKATGTTITGAQWSELAVGDIVVRVKQGTTGGAVFDVVTVAATLPTNVLTGGLAVVDDLYVAMRAQ